MKYLLIASLALSLNAMAQQQAGGSANESSQGSGYSPGHGAKTGEGSFTTPNAGLGGNAPTNATTRGTDISGAGTMGTQEYPNSGQTNNQSSDVTGNDAGSGVQLPGKRNTMSNKRNGEKSFDETLDRGSTQTGPYNTSDEMQAEQAKSGREIEPDSEQEKKRKQQGE